MMGKQEKHLEFEQVIERGCGLDVHKSVITATIRGADIKEKTRNYDGFTDSLESLRNWFKESNITHVAKKSIGVYWKPLCNILEEDSAI